jgi:hypothetical protein
MTDRSCPFIAGKEISGWKTSVRATGYEFIVIVVAGM